MKGLVGGLLVSLVGWVPLLAQETDRSLERIGIALERPLPIVVAVDQADSALPKTLGIFTFVPPTRPGEMVRVSVPIGKLVSRAFKGVVAAHQRRREIAARQEVNAALTWFSQQQDGTKR